MLSGKKWYVRQRNVHIFNDDDTGKRQNLALHITKYYMYLHTVSSHSNLNCYYCPGGGDQLKQSTVHGQIRCWIFPRTWHNSIWKFSVSAHYYWKWTWHAEQAERHGSLTEQFFTEFSYSLFYWFWNSDSAIENTNPHILQKLSHNISNTMKDKHIRYYWQSWTN